MRVGSLACRAAKVERGTRFDPEPKKKRDDDGDGGLDQLDMFTPVAPLPAPTELPFPVPRSLNS